MLNNYWSPKWAGRKDILLQYGYVIRSNEHFDPAVCARWGREARVPLEVCALKSSDKLPGLRGRLPGAEASLAAVSPDNVLLIAIKPAEDGEGLVVRLLETGGRETDGVVRLPLFASKGARESNAVEVAGRPLKNDAQGVHFHVKLYQIMTIRLLARPESSALQSAASDGKP